MMPKRGGLLERVSREEWNIGIIRQSAPDIVRRGIAQPVRWLPPMHPWNGLADPACYIAADGTRTLYAERMSYWKGRGEIWAAKVAPDRDLATTQLQRWATAQTHLSYPFPFAVGADLCFTMETGDAGQLNLWRYRRGTWTQTELLARPVIDPTFGASAIDGGCSALSPITSRTRT